MEARDGANTRVPHEGGRAFQAGWRLVFAAGFIPASAGLAMLLLALWSSTAGWDSGWISLVGRHPFSAAQIKTWDRELAALWILTVHICGVNLLMSGVTISTLALRALRQGSHAAWVYLWLMFIWVGGSDLFALIRYRMEIGSGIPFTIVPVLLGVIGLSLARPARRPQALEP